MIRVEIPLVHGEVDHDAVELYMIYSIVYGQNNHGNEMLGLHLGIQDSAPCVALGHLISKPNPDILVDTPSR